MRPRIPIAICAACLAVIACRDDGSQSGQVLAWPPRAMGGDTVSIGIETTRIDYDPYKHFDLSTENLTLRLEEVGQPANFIEIDPRAVVSATADAATELERNHPGTELQIAVFDVPDGSQVALPFSAYPASIRVVPLREGIPLNEGTTSSFAVFELEAATGGQATPFWPPSGLQELEPLPSLRLRPLWYDAGGLRFEPTWTIGSIQFDLGYPVAVQNPKAIAKGRASGGTALARPIGSQTARVLVVAPDGFQLPPTAGSGLGLGPLIDVVFDKTGAFDESGFTLTNLVVTDPDGNPLVEEPGDASAYFTMIVRRNQ